MSAASAKICNNIFSLDRKKKLHEVQKHKNQTKRKQQQKNGSKDFN